MNDMNNCTATESWKEAKQRSIDTLKAKRIFRIAEYDKNPTRCLHCGRTFEYVNRHKKFCDRSCSASHNNKGIRRNDSSVGHSYLLDGQKSKKCIHCGNEIANSKNNSKFCSMKCAGEYRRKQSIEDWLNNYENMPVLPYGIRNHIVESAGNKCCMCGWGEINPYSGRYSLVVDHIDGNPTNNSPTNLRVICPNCDSLSKTYMGLNRGNGRIWRRLQYHRRKNNN